MADKNALFYSVAFNSAPVMKDNIMSVLRVWCFQVLSSEARRTQCLRQILIPFFFCFVFF